MLCLASRHPSLRTLQVDEGVKFYGENKEAVDKAAKVAYNNRETVAKVRVFSVGVYMILLYFVRVLFVVD
jgi:hypothetical protein